MMRRRASLSQLNLAVTQSVVTIFRGLPSVGRSAILADWRDQRIDVKHCQTVADVQNEPSVFILDHVDEQQVDAVVDMVRSMQNSKSRTRLVVAPSNLVAAEKLRGALPGVVALVDVVPLRVEEVANASSALTMMTGPLIAAPSASAAPNRQPITAQHHWLRGGFPKSLLADTDQTSLSWRCEMLDALLARDYTEWGVERSFPLIEVLRWLAKQNGGELEYTSCKLGKNAEVRSAVYVLERMGIIRRIFNISQSGDSIMGGKSKIIIRDSGILHAMLGIENFRQLQAHGGIGGSFETLATEALILAGNSSCGAHFYREGGRDGADEIDLVLDFPSQSGRLVGIEFKVAPSARAKKGFYNGCTQLGIEDRFIVHSGDKSSLDNGPDRLDLMSAIGRVATIASGG